MEQEDKGTWKTPEEVLRYHRLKKRMSMRSNGQPASPITYSSNSTNSEDSLMEFPVVTKRKFPFPVTERNTRRAEETDSGMEADLSSHSGERTLFNLLDRTHINSPKTPTSFSNIIHHLSPSPKPKRAIIQPLSPDAASPSSVDSDAPKKKIPIDWSMKNKIRFMSTKPFNWTATMRTTEQVSAITGFARCIEPSRIPDGTIDLDTSVNSQLHRCCLYWQHPHLPWLPLFARTTTKLSPAIVAAQLQIADTLHQEFIVAFKSLLQLIRTQQCPYFYLIGTQFNCLFRAAGMAGQAEPNVLITPTTRGFRKLLEDEDIAYKMPLRKSKRYDGTSSHDEDSLSQASQQTSDMSDEDDDVDDLMDSDQVRKLTSAQKAKDRRAESRLDGSGDSLVMVTGMDLQGLFNLLVNCKNNMDRLPPTLLAPTAFQLATLRSSQVKDSLVQVDGTQLYSVQVEGPIMPHALAQICLLLDEAGSEYSAALATLKQTRPFTMVNALLGDDVTKPVSSMFFVKEYLSDCGLSKRVMTRLCESDPSQFGIIDSIEPQQCI